MACNTSVRALFCAAKRGKLTLDDGHDSALLDGGRALETVGVDSTEELGLQVHRVEGVGGLIVVGLDLACVVGQPCVRANIQAGGAGGRSAGRAAQPAAR